MTAWSYTDAEREEALRRFRANESTRDIADAIGCSQRTVSYWAKRAGLSRPKPGPRRHSADEWARVVATYLGGRSSLYTAYVHGVSKQCVLKWLREAGHEPRPDPRKLDDAQIARLHAELGSGRKVAKIVGCTYGGVYASLSRTRRNKARAELGMGLRMALGQEAAE